MAVRWGILSTAGINREMLAGASASAEVDVVAIASRDLERAQSFAREHNIEHAYGSYEELLADGEVEAVYNPLPNSLHVDWSMRALEHGKHVLCEKPLARRPTDVKDAFDLAANQGLVLMEAFMYRHHPQTLEVERLVREGAIGRLRAIRATFSFRLTDDANIRLRSDLDGGALMDLGCYCVSGARLLAGEPEWVYGEAVIGETGVDTAFHGTLRLTEDVVAQFDASFVAPIRQSLEVVGEEGTLEVEAPWRIDWGGRVLLRRGEEVEIVRVAEADSYRLELENMSAAIRGSATLLLDRSDALAQATVLEALYGSAEVRRPVQLRVG